MDKLCGFPVGLDKPFFLIAGPCVIESEALALDTAAQLKAITDELHIPFIDFVDAMRPNARRTAKEVYGLKY